MSKNEFASRSEFRYRLTCFLRFGEQVAQAEGITLPQYLLLLHVKGTRGRSWALVGELAERLQLRHHSTVELVSRCEAAELVERRRSDDDRREVQIHLTRTGERTLQRIAAAQTGELSALLKNLRVDKKGHAQPQHEREEFKNEASRAAPRKRPGRSRVVHSSRR